MLFVFYTCFSSYSFGERLVSNWSCDWPGHEGDNDFKYSDEFYGCDTVLDCNFAICKACFLNLKVLQGEGHPTVCQQPTGTATRHVENGEYYIEIPSVSVTISSEGAVSVYAQYNVRGGDEGMPNPETCRLYVGDLEPILPNSQNIFTKDEFQITGMAVFNLPAEYVDPACAEAVYLDGGNEYFTKIPLQLPGASFEHTPNVPGCGGEAKHPMIISDYDGGAYNEEGWVCDRCTRHLDRERWWCKTDCSDVCFTCHPAPVLYPKCPDGHTMERWQSGKMPPAYDECICDICDRDGLQHNSEYFHCKDCEYDSCLSCAQQQSAGVDPAEYSVDVLDEQQIGYA